ncbi:hypothetical protein H6P81_010788 [Aristolochia fimbriata]|uniref:Protein kinase domain-containing protein n=1 Tax=Aristolochia fimbriata TaxID=158543 RepID=A0AAV7EPZ6_ARIFI|nr:hypothetical protein H6P81_010788 [Aristolochia fimbriata]
MQDFNTKLSDFGLAKVRPCWRWNPCFYSSNGTHGYAMPEYIVIGRLIGRLSVKSDVYNFGVVLLELLNARRSLGMKKVGIEQSLVDWAKPY